jgi:hypothetical protein
MSLEYDYAANDGAKENCFASSSVQKYGFHVIRLVQILPVTNECLILTLTIYQHAETPMNLELIRHQHRWLRPVSGIHWKCFGEFKLSFHITQQLLT